MKHSLERELEVASIAVQYCAHLTNQLQQQTLSPESSVKKWDHSPVTIGDFAVQALLTTAIRSEFKDDRFLAEESADELRENAALLDQVWELVETFRASFPSNHVPSSKADLLDAIDQGGKGDTSNEGRTWIFDPIVPQLMRPLESTDGTATFMRGQQYAINCALAIDGREEIGIIGCPNLPIDSGTVHEDDIDSDGLGLMIFAIRDQGTWVRPMQFDANLAPATRVPRHGDQTDMDQLIWTDCSTYTSTIQHLQQQVAAKLGISWPGVDLYSSIVKYAALGLGRASVCIRIFKFASWRSNSWDHAGGVLIFEEAGGKVTDLDGKAIDFCHGRKMSANYGLVCAPSSVHAEVLRVVQDVLKAHGSIPWSR
ncbi:hypothetical protein LTR37_011563 [Vermiconidia calcicola]|uniref:Uncharacterized protein n=1 Tax=Vermiconidia calcicola TaxID=1690605 RepID=A0ACC3N3B5_9PEZI|nr:hypothetical protein LTR37_011563 [Vermiconidia calcicola]